MIAKANAGPPWRAWPWARAKWWFDPIPGILHVLVYAGFVIINIEVLEIVIDGVFGTHRVFSFLGGFYDVLIASFEVLALLVLVACVIFLIRREVLRVKRFWNKEMDGWPRTDADADPGDGDPADGRLPED